jgi:hypothetical protein
MPVSSPGTPKPDGTDSRCKMDPLDVRLFFVQGARCGQSWTGVQRREVAAWASRSRAELFRALLGMPFCRSEVIAPDQTRVGE